MIEFSMMSDLVNEMKFYKEHFIKTVTEENEKLRAQLWAAHAALTSIAEDESWRGTTDYATLTHYILDLQDIARKAMQPKRDIDDEIKALKIKRRLECEDSPL